MSKLMDNSALRDISNEAALINDIMYMDLHWIDVKNGKSVKDIVDDLDIEYNSGSYDEALDKYKDHVNEENEKLKKELIEDSVSKSEIEKYEFKQRRDDIKMLNAYCKKDGHKEFVKMRIGNQTRIGDDNKYPDDGLTAATFTDSKGNVMVAYRGT